MPINDDDIIETTANTVEHVLHIIDTLLVLKPKLEALRTQILSRTVATDEDFVFTPKPKTKRIHLKLNDCFHILQSSQGEAALASAYGCDISTIDRVRKGKWRPKARGEFEPYHKVWVKSRWNSALTTFK